MNTGTTDTGTPKRRKTTRNTGTQEHTNPESQEPGNTRTQELVCVCAKTRDTGRQDHRKTGRQEHKNTGTHEHIGTQEHRNAGTQEHRNTEEHTNTGKRATQEYMKTITQERRTQ